jgi:hypothetical protein
MVPAVKIPFFDEEGYELRECARYRTGLEKTTPDTRMRATPKARGGALTLYGRHGTEEARELGTSLLSKAKAIAIPFGTTENRRSAFLGSKTGGRSGQNSSRGSTGYSSSSRMKPERSSGGHC